MPLAEPHAGDLAKRRVRLLRGGRVDAGAHAAALRAALERRRLALGDLVAGGPCGPAAGWWALLPSCLLVESLVLRSNLPTHAVGCVAPPPARCDIQIVDGSRAPMGAGAQLTGKERTSGSCPNGSGTVVKITRQVFSRVKTGSPRPVSPDVSPIAIRLVQDRPRRGGRGRTRRPRSPTAARCSSTRRSAGVTSPVPRPARRTPRSPCSRSRRTPGRPRRDEGHTAHEAIARMRAMMALLDVCGPGGAQGPPGYPGGG